MPSGRDVNLGRRGSGTTKKNAFCSFCRKSYRDVGPLVEGPGDVYICGECIELCQSILEQEQRIRNAPSPDKADSAGVEEEKAKTDRPPSGQKANGPEENSRSPVAEQSANSPPAGSPSSGENRKP